jgi:hypothetical protein
MLAGRELRDYGRKEAVWVIILLSDGVANAAYAVNPDFTPLNDPLIADDWYCPTDFWRDYTDPNLGRFYDDHLGPWCANGGYPALTYQNGDSLGGTSDPDDAARYWADWAACYPSGENVHCASPGQGAVIFTIGLGDATTNYDGPYPAVGEQLLRYIANVGYDGNPSLDSSTDQCFGIASGTNCGNYFYSPIDGSQLIPIFNAIADRIFTRLTH